MSLVIRALLAGSVLGLGGCVYYLNPQCTDMILNGDETDVDCGGPCSKCAIGDACRVEEDCDRSTCISGTCRPLPCDNGVQDADETDVDCGGAVCRKCAGNRGCSVGSDCYSNNCVPGENRCFALDLAFADQVPYESGERPYAIFSGDLDGDLDIDLVAANQQASTLSVFLNSGTGTFTRLGAYFTGEYPTGGAMIDLDQDGKLDVVTADFRGNSVSVVRGDGTGGLAAPVSYPTAEGAQTSNVAVGDLDGDTLADILATNPMTSSASMFIANPDGTLDPAVDLLVGIAAASNPYSAGIGDFNQDGRSDIAIADSRSGQVIVRLGNGDGTFQPEVAYRIGGTPPYILVTGDVDVDGTVDLLIANRGSNNISVLTGRGEGTFRKPVVSPTGDGTGPYSLAVSDFNQDGLPDVVTANYITSNASVLLGLGDASFEAPFDAGPTGTVTYGVTAADFNADGKPDFATANSNTNNITVKLSTSQ